MTDNDWITPKKEYKKKYSEETFFLSEILSNGGCMSCINNRCDISEEHGSFFPDKLCTFVKNPTYIDEIKKSIDLAKLNFDNKKPYFKVCNYVKSNCRNCDEGRITYIKVNNKNVALCYPIFNKIKHTVTIGVHIDIKLVLKGNKYTVSCLPINMDKYNKIDVKSVDKDKSIDLSLEKWEKISDTKPIESIEQIEPLNYLKIKDSFKKLSKNIQEEQTSKSEELIDNVETSISLVKNKITLNAFSYNKNLRHETEYIDNGNRFLEDNYIKDLFNYNNIDEINSLNTRVTKQFFDTDYSKYIII